MQRLMATTLGCEGQKETLLSMNIDRKKDKMEGTAGLLGARGGASLLPHLLDFEGGQRN